MAETGHCDLDFIYQPPSRHREQVFRLLCQQITGGNVLDVGCGAVGHYWALAYAGRVSSFTLSDKDRGMIELEMQRIEMLTPDTLNVRFPGTLSLLDTLDASRTTLERVQALHRKLADCVVLDCSKASISNRYDVIIANELFENLEKVSHLEPALSNLKKLLVSGGCILGTSLVSENQTFGAEEFAAVARASGLEVLHLESYTPDLHRYPSAFTFVLRPTIDR